MELLNNRVREYRERQGLTQTRFASELKITNDYLSSIETGKKIPSFKLARKIANYFEVTIDDIFFTLCRTKNS